MEIPFTYGKIATNKDFIGREVETTNLVWNFVSLSNTFIIAPRRWGKNSLVNMAAKLVMEQDNKLRICHIDLFYMPTGRRRSILQSKFRNRRFGNSRFATINKLCRYIGCFYSFILNSRYRIPP